MSVIYHLQGWFEQNTEGIGTVYFSIIDEGLITNKVDTPSSTAYLPRIKNPDTFSIKRMATFWPWGQPDASFAAIGELDIDNYDGAFDFLLSADLRDAPVVFKIVDRGMLGGNSTVSGGLIVATAIIDDIASDNEDVIQITFKDKLSNLDTQLPVRYNAPYVDSNAANQMVPMTFGSCRNVSPQLINSEGVDNDGLPLYRLHDAALSNIAQVRDMGAILDTNSDPPQVVPALSFSGIQLQVLPDGKLLVDCSSVGAQAIQPGAVDVLAGLGLLTDWPSAGSPPTGWSYQTSPAPDGSFIRVGTPTYPQDYCLSVETEKAYRPLSSQFGQYEYVTTPFLQPGQTYRIKFSLDRMTVSLEGGGFMVRTNLTLDPVGDVSGGPNGPYIVSPQFGTEQYSFEYKCPNDGLVRTLYMILVGGGGSGPPFSSFCVWHGLTVELLGQFDEQPLESITLGNFYREILYLRAYQDSASWSASDLDAIDSTTGYGFGIHYDSPPNIYRDCLLGPLPSYCATAFTDAEGIIRVRRLEDPKLATPVAIFSMSETSRPIQIAPDRAQYLTTLMGARRNWTISGPSDFVTDYALVPADVRMRYGRNSQYQVTSSKTPAGQYSHAIGAPVFDSLIDKPEDAQREIDRVVSLYSPQVYADGTIFNGKRRFITATLSFDEAGILGDQSIGTAPLTAPDLLIGDTVLLSYSHSNGVAMLDNTPVFIAGTELFPFGNKLIITGWF